MVLGRFSRKLDIVNFYERSPPIMYLVAIRYPPKDPAHDGYCRESFRYFTTSASVLFGDSIDVITIDSGSFPGSSS